MLAVGLAARRVACRDELIPLAVRQPTTCPWVTEKQPPTSQDRDLREGGGGQGTSTRLAAAGRPRHGGSQQPWPVEKKALFHGRARHRAVTSNQRRTAQEVEWSLGSFLPTSRHRARSSPFRAAQQSADGLCCISGWPWCVLGNPPCRGSVLTGLSAGMVLQNAAMMYLTRCTWTKCELYTQVRQMVGHLDKNNTVLTPDTPSRAWAERCPSG